MQVRENMMYNFVTGSSKISLLANSINIFGESFEQATAFELLAKKRGGGV